MEESLIKTRKIKSYTRWDNGSDYRMLGPVTGTSRVQWRDSGTLMMGGLYLTTS